MRVNDRVRMRVNEIFYSLQGEGAHAGVPSVFIRLSGCNLRCWFCDTQHQNGTDMSVEEIIAAVNSYPAQWVILTGGEPSLQITGEFIRKLKEHTGKLVAIETNGTRQLPEEIDWVTLSPKTGIAENAEIVIRRADEIVGKNAEIAIGRADEIVAENTEIAIGRADEIVAENAEIVIGRADEIKVVDIGQELEAYFSLPCRKESTQMFLQPCFVEDAAERQRNIERTVGRVLADPRWRLSAQLHRFLGIQ